MKEHGDPPTSGTIALGGRSTVAAKCFRTVFFVHADCLPEQPLSALLFCLGHGGDTCSSARKVLHGVSLHQATAQRSIACPFFSFLTLLLLHVLLAPCPCDIRPVRRAGEKLERSVESLPVLPISLEEVEERTVRWRVRHRGRWTKCRVRRGDACHT